MSDDAKVYKITELTATSTESISEAVRTAVDRAGQTIRHLDWFEVGEIRGRIADQAVAEFQVTVKLGFRLE